jgi:hypothetical protein
MCLRDSQDEASHSRKGEFSTKKIKILLGTLAMMLAFGLTVVSCADEGDDPPAPVLDVALVATWYGTQVLAQAAYRGSIYQFMADGIYCISGISGSPNTSGHGYGTWYTAGGKIIIKIAGLESSAKYSISGTELTITESSARFPIPENKYYKP